MPGQKVPAGPGMDVKGITKEGHKKQEARHLSRPLNNIKTMKNTQVYTI